MAADKVYVENINHPGKISMVDKTPYVTMKRAILKVLPKRPPGMSPGGIYKAILPLLSEDVFPSGAKACWWVNCVQLDLEAKGIIHRSMTSPLRLTRA